VHKNGELKSLIFFAHHSGAAWQTALAKACLLVKGLSICRL